MFGTSPAICALLWDYDGWVATAWLSASSSTVALMFLKLYASEHVHASIAQVDEKTFRKWHLLSSRLRDAPISGCRATIDGTDCLINEPKPFNSARYSHKSNSAGVRYEVAVSVRSARIVWAHGPWPYSIYADERCIQPPGSHDHLHSTYSLLRGRHENMNKRLKQFFVLRHRFRHDIDLHVFCFHAVLNVTALMLEEEPLQHLEF
eukprot:IDg1902t1